MKIAITGVTGFLGGVTAKTLSERGHKVLGLVRNPEQWTDRPLSAEVVQFDLFQPQALRNLLTDVDVFLHVAALVKLWVKNPADYDAINVEGFKAIAEICHETNTPLVYVSSFFALGSTEGIVVDETRDRPDEPTFTHYVRTKTAADQLAAELVDRQPLVRLYPGVVFGPGAWTEGNHVLRTLAQHADGKLPGLLGPADRRQCFAYVKDVAQGIAQAVEKLPAGEKFILGGENKTVTELFDCFAKETGIKPPKIHIPYAMARVVGKLQRWRAQYFGVQPELTDDVVSLYKREWAFSSAKAQQSLGYTITPFEQAIHESVEWMKQQGYLQPKDKS